MTQELVASGMVLESEAHGPELCLGMVLASNPPQGGGPAVTNWDWSSVSGQTSLRGTTWGHYTVVGTYADGAFTLTRPPVPVTAQTPDDTGDSEAHEGPPRTPCAPPPGGWQVVDPNRTTEETLDRTVDVAQRLLDFGDLWIDRIDDPALGGTAGEDDDEEGEWGVDDPMTTILNVAVTGDPAVAEATLRRTWGGALCVSVAHRSRRELERILDEVGERPDLLMAGPGHDRVDVYVIHDDGSLQRELDERYSAGAVRVTSALRPHQPT